MTQPLFTSAWQISVAVPQLGDGCWQTARVYLKLCERPGTVMIATMLLVCILLALAAAAYFPGNGR